MRTWIYLINPFLGRKIRPRRLLEIAIFLKNVFLFEKDTNAAINAEFVKLMLIFEPFQSAIEALLGSKGTSLGETERFNQEMENLPDNLRKWDNAIKVHFDEDTPEHRILFPHGRSDIYKGKLIDQFSKLVVLRDQLAHYPALSAVQDLVDTFCSLLLSLQDTKSASYTGNSAASLDLDTKRIALGVEMYRILGFLIEKNAANPTNVEHYFPLNLLRTQTSDDEGGEEEAYSKVYAPSTSGPADISFSPDDRLLLTLTGDAAMKYWGAVDPADEMPPTAVLLQPGDSVEVTATSLGAPVAKYLMFANEDTVLEGVVEIVLL